MISLSLEKYKDDIIKFLEKEVNLILKDQYIVKIVIESEDRLNATVEKIKDEEDKYLIRIYSGLIGGIPYLLEKYLVRLDANDLLYFKDFNFFNFLRILDPSKYNDLSEEDTRLLTLQKLFNTSILLNVVFHEIGHILSGHLQNMNLISEENDSINTIASQEKEMVADWYGAKILFEHIIYISRYYEINTIDFSNAKKLFTKPLVFTILSLYLMFNLFEGEYNFNIEELLKYKHPHPRVRLFYTLEAVRECIYDILNNYLKTTDKVIEPLVDEIIREALIYVDSFFSVIDINNEIFDKNVIKHYFLLREYPYSKQFEEDDSVHLCKLQDLNIKYLKIYN